MESSCMSGKQRNMCVEDEAMQEEDVKKMKQ